MIGDGVIFGGLAAVQQFCRVGKGAMVGGLTGVNRDVIPYAMAFGDHVELAGLNLIGLKRRGLSQGCHQRHARHLPQRVLWQRRQHRRPRPRRGANIRRMCRKWREIADFILADAKQELCLARRRGAVMGKRAGPHRGRRRRCRARWRRRPRRPDARFSWSRWSAASRTTWVKDFPHELLSPGEPGRIIKALKGAGVGDVLLCGPGGPAQIPGHETGRQGHAAAAQGDRGGAARATTRCCASLSASATMRA